MTVFLVSPLSPISGEQRQDVGTRNASLSIGKDSAARRVCCALAFLCLLFACVVAMPAQTAVGTPSVTLGAGGITMKYTTGAETITYQVDPPASGSKGLLGSIVVSDAIGGGSPQGQLSLRPALTGLEGGLYLQSASVSSSGGSPVMLLTYVNPLGTTHVTVTPFFDGDVASLRVVADLASIYSLDVGGWQTAAAEKDISVPYYTQAVSYFDALGVFANTYYDPFNSKATTFSGTATIYASKSDGTTNLMSDVVKLAVSADILNVLPTVKNPASPYMGQLAGKMMVDVRALGSQLTVANELSQLGDYGLTNCVVLVHAWQQMGYDNGLPLHYPASNLYGGSSAINDIRGVTSNYGCNFGLHQNYTDYYPNFPSFVSASVMLNANGSEQTGFLNPATKTQALITKPNLFLRFATQQSPLIQSNYGTDVSYIDVNSSALPWFRADRDAAAPGAGTFASYLNAIKALWAYERTANHGPVFGEGREHWFYSGMLDGVEAQFGAESAPILDGTKAPLFVDFDLTRIHPFQINYGMGYYSRWNAERIDAQTTVEQDAYRMQEIIFGHSAYITDPLWMVVPTALQEQGLVTPLAKRYSLAHALQVSYAQAGAWVGASAAAKSGSFQVARVAYTNGDTLVANSSATPLSWNGLVIPQYGWAAKGTNLRAYTAIVGGGIADYAATATTLYANARNQADLLSSTAVASPQMASFAQVKPRVVSIQTAWNVIIPNKTVSYTVFVHFVPTNNPSVVAGNSDNQPAVPTTAWVTGQQVLAPQTLFYLPATMADGTYTVRVGLFAGATRAMLWGNDDGTERYTIGTMTVAKGGQSISFVAAPITVPNPDPRMNSGGSVVDFGTVRTDGMVFLAAGSGQQAGTWTVRSYPRARDVVVEVKSSVLASPSSMTCDNGDVIAPTPVAGGYWQVDLRGRKFCTWNGEASLGAQ